MDWNWCRYDGFVPSYENPIALFTILAKLQVSKVAVLVLWEICLHISAIFGVQVCTTIDSFKESGHNCIPVIFLKNCESELLAGARYSRMDQVKYVEDRL